MRSTAADKGPATRRYAYALIAFVYALGLLAQSLHVTQTKHEVCAHGEVVHVEDAGAEHSSSDAPQAHPLERDGTEHHHCSISTPLLTGEFEWSRPLVAHFGVARTAATRLEREPRAPAFALYLLAPHHSPPVA